MTSEFASEPVRGGKAPPWYTSLPGLERVRAQAQGLIPASPFQRLCGIRVMHGAPGTATVTMQASPWLQTAPGRPDLWPLAVVATGLAGRTLNAPGMFLTPRTHTVNFVRSPSLDMGTFVAKGRVLVAGGSRITTEVVIEDGVGRLLAHVVGQSAILVVDPPPPPVEPFAPLNEPAYQSPDPPLRPLGDQRWLHAPPPTAPGVEVVRRWKDSRPEDRQPPPLPLQRLMGARVVDVEEGSVELVMAAHPWLTNEVGSVLSSIPSFAFLAAGFAGRTVRPGNTALIPNAHNLTWVLNHPGVSQLAPDGRDLTARGRIVFMDANVVVADTDVFDPDGKHIAFGRSTAALTPWRQDAIESAGDRVLAAVLFVDTVDSTALVERLGDAGWRQLLERNLASLRREIQVAEGREVKTEGDGFLATFDSPAKAVRCARAVRDAARGLGLQIRAGIHLGEVETIGTDVAGIAVHVAKRVESAAKPGEIFVTSTVRESMAGSGMVFSSRGLHDLKGIEDEWHLFAVEG